MGLETAIESLSILNSWIKGDGHRPRKAVYWIKSNYAVRDAFMHNLVSGFRYVTVNVKCNRCEDGKFYNWHGDYKGSCHTCNGTGRANLRFAETEIMGKFKWHSPIRYGSWQGWSLDDMDPVAIDSEWQPNQRDGADISIDEAARHLNVVESHWDQWVTKKPYENFCDEFYDNNKFLLFDYRLDIGRVGDESKCFKCGGKSSHGMSTSKTRVQFTVMCCKACSEIEGIWDDVRNVPFNIGPNLAEWNRRHSRLFQKDLERWQYKDLNWDVLRPMSLEL